MRTERRLVVMLEAMAVIFLVGGCGDLRFAPGERQKQNAYLHHRTVEEAARQARQEEVSPSLRQLTGRAVGQSEAIMAYYGLPREIPPARQVEDILSAESEALTQQARQEGWERPDPWQAADHLLELAMAMAGLVGGVYGSRIAGAIGTARQKSKALREIVTGNELFKNSHPEMTDAFKQSQQQQSEGTRQMVAAIK